MPNNIINIPAGCETGSLNLALNRAAAGLKQIAGAQANTAHNLNAEQAIAGRTKETFFTIYDSSSDTDSMINNSSHAGVLEGTPWNHIGVAGKPVQSMEKSHLSLTADRSFFPVTNSKGELYYTRVGSFKPNGSDVYTNHFGMTLQYVPAEDSGNVPTNISQANLKPFSIAGLSMPNKASDTITVAAGLSGDIGNSIVKNFNVIDPTGTARTLTFTFTRVDPPMGSTYSQAWNLSVQTPTGSVVNGSYSAGSPQMIQFNADGTPAVFSGNATPAPLSINWPNGSSTINLNLGHPNETNGLMTTAGGPSFLTVISNGYPSGNLLNVQFSEDGDIYGTFSNNQTKLLGKLAVGIFNNPDELEPISNSLYVPTGKSGAVYFKCIGDQEAGLVAPGALESSNVNVITEMSNMVQRELQFNVVSTVSHTSKNMWESVIKTVER